MRILILGGSGNIGTRLGEQLLIRQEVRYIGSVSRNLPKKREASVTYFVGDSNDQKFLNEVFETGKFDCVVHIPNILLADFEVLLSVCASHHIRQLIVVGSAAMFTKLDAPTREIRLSQEKLIRDSGIPYTILRPNMVYGHRRDQNIFQLFSYLQKYPILFVPGSADIRQNPTHVDDFVSAMINAILNPRAFNKSYNLVGPEPISMKQMVRILDKKNRVRIIEIPLSWSLVGLKILRFLKLLDWHPEKLHRLNEEKVLETTRGANEELGYCPRSFQEGIKGYQ